MTQSRRSRILIVDDTRENIHILMETLKDDYALMVATNGDKALQIAMSDVLPDLILLDVMMPGINGYEVCRQLKASPRTSRIPVIFITALTDEADEALGLHLGAVDYITKPVNPDLVKARVRNHLALYHARLDLRQRNDELERANTELKALNEQTREILGIAVHDLKNPLTSICGFVEIGIMFEETGGATPEQRLDAFNRIKASSLHMLDIINEMLSSERLDSGCLKLQCASTNLSAIINQGCQLNQGNAERKQIELIRDIPDLIKAHIDGHQIREVVDNLISNAIKFSPKGKRIWVSLAEDAGMARFTIKDEGPGFTKEDCGKMFGRFQRLSAVPTGGEPTSGLGLSIVKRLVELHGGTINVESEPGAGATFIVALPQKG